MVGGTTGSGSTMAFTSRGARDSRPEVERLHTFLESRVQELRAHAAPVGESQAASDVILNAFALASGVAMELRAQVR